MLVESLLKNARRFPRKPAALDPHQKFTYAQLLTCAAVFRRLVDQNTSGPRVAIMLPPSAAGLGGLLGILWAGRAVVPLNFLLQPRELAAIIADAQLDLILSTEHFQSELADVSARVLFLEKLNLKRYFLAEKLRSTPGPPDVGEDDLAAIVYTSGTTGVPKGVCLSQNNFVSNARGAIEFLKFKPEEHLLGVLPSFHVFGLSVLHFLPVILGATVTYLPRFSPQAVYRTISSAGITALLAVPSMYAAIGRLKNLDPDRFKRVVLAASGGEPLPQTVYDMFFRRTGIRLVQGYGLTETSPIISVDSPYRHRPGTVGPPLPGVQIELRDDTGGALPGADQGELYVRGPLVMKGYYNQPDQTAQVLDEDGWFRTGDVARLHQDGYLSITGRVKELIIVGGEKVYPREVEAVLEQNPAVAEAAVTGQPDGSRGEVVVAYVTLSENSQVTGDELRAFCRENLAGFKTPRRIYVRSDMPRGPTGKILKSQLKNPAHHNEL